MSKVSKHSLLLNIMALQRELTTGFSLQVVVLLV
jgi:hypothetical protein